MSKEYNLQPIIDLVEADKTKRIGMPNWMFLEQCIEYLESSQKFLDKYEIKIKYIKEN